MSFKTQQEEFWAGQFGTDYISRNKSAQLLASNHAFFSRILGRTQGVESVLEIGANVGMNIRALKNLLPEGDFWGVEINTEAHSELSALIGEEKAFLGSALDVDLRVSFDLVFTKTVLIHIAPEHLEQIYKKLADLSHRYVLIAEYYNPSPVSVKYRGHEERLFKRDFAGEFLEHNTGFELVDYGFVYHRDRVYPQDDITWFLMKRS